MSAPFAYANLGTRHPLDSYGTPAAVTYALVATLRGLGRRLRGPVLEPACGPHKLIAKELKREGYSVRASDIVTGTDFLRRRALWPGSIVTNPPYKNGLELAFAELALTLARGQVAMLLRTNLLHGTTRNYSFWKAHPVIDVLVIPWRILFIQESGEPISGQGYDHSWFVWDNARSSTQDRTRLTICDPSFKEYKP